LQGAGRCGRVNISVALLRALCLVVILHIPLEFYKMKLITVPITLREANDFVANFHRHNGRTSRNGGKFAIGCSNGNQLVGVAIVGLPIARTLADGFTAEVLRCCVIDSAPKNVNSFLYACCWRAWRAMGGKKLITYTLKSESGASLRGAGWRVVAECKPGGWDRPNIERVRRWKPIYGQTKFRWEITPGEKFVKN
jgi:hypothetical protein